MTQHTSRDHIWNHALAVAEEKRGESSWSRYFGWADVAERFDEDDAPSERTIRDTLATMADLGHLEENRRKGKYEPLEDAE